MTWCYRRDCARAAQYHVTVAANPLWRRLLRLPLRQWDACPDHRYDPSGSTLSTRTQP